MSRCQKDPLRPLTGVEQQALTQLSRSPAAPAAEVARATLLLAVARGASYQQAASSAGRRSGDAVSRLGGARPHPRRGRPDPDPGARRHRLLVARATPEGPPVRPGRAAARLDIHPLASAP